MMFRPVRVVTIGHRQHGKLSLTSAIAKLLTGEQGERRVERTGGAAGLDCFGYRTPTRSYLHDVCCGWDHHARYAIASLATAHGAVLVVAADEGPQQQT